MPRAVDPSLPGGGLPITHSPLNRMRHNVIPQELDLEKILGDIEDLIVQQLQDYLFPAIKSLTGIDLGVFLPLLDQIDLDFSSPTAFLTSLAEAIINVGTALLGPNSPLNALNLFNLIPTDLLAQLNFSSIGEAVTNLVTDHTFTDAVNFNGAGVYVHDATEGHAGGGSAKTTADGTGSKDLLSNLIAVSKGQVMPISGWAKWAGLTAAGGSFPIQLNVTGYANNGADAINQTTIAQRSPTPPTTDWTHLSGTYTVPDNVTGIRVRLTVSPAATAGDVWWDDLSATKTQAMFQRLIAGTDIGTFLPDDIGNLFTGVVTNALELVNKAAQGDLDELISTLAGDIGDTIEDVGQRLETFLDGLSPLNANNINQGNIADQFVGGIGTLIDTVVTNVLNISGSGFGHTDSANAFQSLTHALVDVSARTARMETTFTGGVSEGDDFERTSSSSLGTGWLTYYSSGSGTWATPNGHEASWIPSGIGNRAFISIRNTGVIRSATDLQRVAMVLSSKAPEWFGYCGHNDLWLRISDDTTSLANVTGIRIGFGGDGSLSIDRFVAGVGTRLNELGPGSIVPPGPGAQIVGLAGEPGTARVFRAYIGTSMRLEIPEVGVASGLGGAFRRWGHGGRAEGHLLPTPGQDGPGSAHQWTAMDQVSL